jgi:hypothetical protein
VAARTSTDASRESGLTKPTGKYTRLSSVDQHLPLGACLSCLGQLSQGAETGWTWDLLAPTISPKSDAVFFCPFCGDSVILGCGGT